MKKTELIVSIVMLIFSISFNLWLYRAEPTAMVDPNDNAFQYALVERTNVIWDYADRTCGQGFFRLLPSVTCHLSLLIDHWVPNWAEGYNLPYYYSHVPQILIVGSYRFINWASKFPMLNAQFSKNVSNIQNSKLIDHSSLIIDHLSLFTYYHWIIYLLLCMFPLSVFLSIRLLKCSWLTAGIGALLASHISTDGLYGIDPSSFLWRGWGLSSQLFSVIFFPLAIAYIIRVTSYELGVKIKNNKNLTSYLLPLTSYVLAIIFITLTTMGHLGIGMMLFLSIPVITFTKPLLTLCKISSASGSAELTVEAWRIRLEKIRTACVQTLFLALPPLVLLSYWIFPTIRDSIYHNTSFWDPIWKFNSYGVMEVLTNLFNGNLFDFGRLPIFTILVFIGFFVCLLNNWRVARNSLDENKECGEQTKFNAASLPLKDRANGEEEIGTEVASKFSFATKAFLYPELSFLFIFFLLLYFGNTTWGGLLNLIPGMNEFHGHRFIVGLQIAGLFLAPIGCMWLLTTTRVMSYELGVKIRNKKNLTSYLLPLTSSISLILILLLLMPPIYKQTISYGTYNQELIEKSNTLYLTQQADAETLIQTLKSLPGGRIFAGRGGSWGKNFEVADSPYFIYLSTYGLPTVLWLPQTWSLNSDVEQYFSEDNPSHYELFNITYVVAPASTSASLDGPPTQTPQKFWNLIKETDHWKLYEVNGQVTINNKQKTTTNYISEGVSPSVVFSDKYSFANVVRLWIQSDYPKKLIFPEIKLLNNPLSLPRRQAGAIRNQSISLLPHFAMTDEANYITPDGKSHSLFAEPPVYINPLNLEFKVQNSELPMTIISQSNDNNMVFKVKVEVKEKCPTCTVILKQTYHPNWKATVQKISDQSETTNQEPRTKNYEPISVFPFYTAIRLEEPGEYEVIFTYTPSPLKMVLLFGGIGSVILLGYFLVKIKK